MKPSIEQISRESNFTFRLKTMQCEECRFDWHYHQEYEIMLMRHCNGELFAGSYSGSTGPNTLALFGPRLPHTFMEKKASTSSGATAPSAQGRRSTKAQVLWFSQSWIQQLLQVLPELAPIEALLADASHGLMYSAKQAEQVANLIEDYDQLSPMQQSHRFIEVLIFLAEAKAPEKLNRIGQRILEEVPGEYNKVVKVIDFIERNFHDPITVDQLASHLYISKSGVQRLFDRHFTESFSEHLKQFRIGKACEQLINSSRPVAVISETAGFSNLSNFNRHFKQCKGLTPREFRARYHQ
ncbi:MAG: AraC family transcriptional regulator [Alteromonadaceae bacterium]|nr:MAG: AraC family transcriptional regulator [Alteromonadaceae bacterium]